MQFDFKKSLPKPGHRFVLPAVHGSADAFMLARAAAALKAERRMLAVIVANATDAQRLLAEIPWFGNQQGEPLRCHLLPDWETLPYDAFSPHQDLVSERLATLHEVQNGQCDVLIVPATTALVRMVSMVSPNKSSRYGRAEPIGNRSIRPPRTEYSPGDMTCATWV